MTDAIDMTDQDIQTLTFRLDSKKESFQKLITVNSMLSLAVIAYGVWRYSEISLIFCLVPILFGLFLTLIYWFTSIIPVKKDLVEQKKYLIKVKVSDKLHHDEFGAESWKIRVSENEFGISIIDIPDIVFDDITLFSQLEIAVSKNAKAMLTYQSI